MRNPKTHHTDVFYHEGPIQLIFLNKGKIIAFSLIITIALFEYKYGFSLAQTIRTFTSNGIPERIMNFKTPTRGKGLTVTSNGIRLCDLLFLCIYFQIY